MVREPVGDSDVRRLVVSGVEQPAQPESGFTEPVEVKPGRIDGQVGVLGLGQGVHLELVVLLGLREDVAELPGGLG